MKTNLRVFSRFAASATLAFFLVACGGGSTTPTSLTSYEISGALTGLTAGQTLVLKTNANPTILSQNGGFKLPETWPTGTSYTVTIGTQPVKETCVVTNGTGVIGVSNVINIAVACTENPQTTYTVGGMVSGLGGELQLVNNNSDVVMVSANGTFALPTPLFDKAAYSVTLGNTLPVGQTCTITHAAGTVQGAKVGSVQVACVNTPVPAPTSATQTYTLGGRLLGLTSGTLVLANGTQSLSLTSNGVFVFPLPVTAGSEHALTVIAQPAGLTCTVANATGTVTNVNVTNVHVTCAATTYSIGGTLSGLTLGEAVVLQNNGGDNRTLAHNGPFVFATQLANGANYSVSVLTHAMGQTCSMAKSSGTVTSANMIAVQVICSDKERNLGDVGPTRLVFYGYTNFIVPAGVTSLTATVTGGGGGGAGVGGGGGAIVTSTLSVSPGQLLVLTVGSGGNHDSAGGGGGASSSVDPGSNHQIIAGGGGGAAPAGSGGDGGTPMGGGGYPAGGGGGDRGVGGYSMIYFGGNGNGGDGGYGVGGGYGGYAGFSAGYGIGGDNSGGAPPPSAWGGIVLAPGSGGGGGGGYGGGGGGDNEGSGGGGGGSTGPAGTTYSAAPKGNGNSNGANGSIVITY